MLTLYLLLVVLLNIPAVQRFIASETCEVLEAKLGTKVRIERIDISLPNRLIIDGLEISDQQRQRLIDSKRLSATVNILPLLTGEISISSIQVFGLDARITQANADSPLNIQFILDSLKSKDDTQKTPLNLHIASIILRNSAVSYDRLDVPRNPGTASPHHLEIKKISGHIMLPTLTDDAVSLKIKKLSFREEHSGINLYNLAFELDADKKHATINDFDIKVGHSSLSFPTATVAYLNNKITSAKANDIKGNFVSKDFSVLVPKLASTNIDIALSANTVYNDKALTINDITLSTPSKDFTLNADADIAFNDAVSWSGNIHKLNIESTFASTILDALQANSIIPVTTALQHVAYTGKISGRTFDPLTGSIDIDGLLTTGIGELKHNISIHNGNVKANLSTPILHLGNIPGASFLGDAIGDISLNTNISKGLSNIHDSHLKVEMPLFTINALPIHNINLTADAATDGADIDLHVADANIATDAKLTLSSLRSLLGTSKNSCSLSGNISTRHIQPRALGLTDKWAADTYSFDLGINTADLKNLLADTDLNISNIAIHSPNDTYDINSIKLSSHEDADKTRTILLESDFCNALIEGRYDITTLPASLTNLITSRMPSLLSPGVLKTTNNNILFDVTLYDALPLRKFLGIDLETPQPVTLNGFVDDAMHNADITFSAPDIIYGGTSYANTDIHAFTSNDSLHINGDTRKINNDGTIFLLDLNAVAASNKASTSISFNNGKKQLLAGEINADLQILKDLDGRQSFEVDVQPSHIITGDSLWSVRPSHISYAGKRLKVNNFLIEHNRQHIAINGEASDNLADVLAVNLQDVNVKYILDFVNFDDVDFDGYATGTAVARGLFADNRDLKADLIIKDFLFSYGHMGTLHANALWNNDLGQIDIDAFCTEGEEKTTFIKGYVSPTREALDLKIQALHTPLEFLGGLCSSFVSDMQGHCKGFVNIAGDFKTINMSGNAIATGSVRIPSTNVTYSFNDIAVTMNPGEILVDNDTIRDRDGHIAVVNGKIMHRYLGRWSYDLDIDAQHLICYDFPTLAHGETFCGHVVGSGSCRITGRPGETRFDIKATPEKGTYILYNVSSPDALQNQEFITWGEIPDSTATEAETAEGEAAKHVQTGTTDYSLRSDIRMNVLVDCTTDATLRLLMDAATGDEISLNGTGVLRATYHNKSGMQIYGNYAVQHGTYNMTIQNLLKKEFTFLPEGGITFNGAPFGSSLNMRAKYVLNSVPLSDLQIGSSFNNSVRVNCLMNIGGIASDPKVEFSLELPQASSDIQQMITSYIDSEDEMNQQVIYLLAIGRFYNSESNSANSSTSQTSLAMQSFISGTVSQQFNSALSGILKSNNWNFGANVAPGNEGFNNAEYEGVLSGRLLNNRLLINGQFGYRDNQNATSSFIGDFDVRYLLTPSGNMSVHVYNQTSDRYFSRSTLNTQGLGIIIKRDFNSFGELFRKRKKQQ